MVFQFARWRPDASGLSEPTLLAARNVVPNVSGFKPLKSPSQVSAALPSRCFGAATMLKLNGLPTSYAGTQFGLYRLDEFAEWEDLTWAGGSYNTAVDDRWNFDRFGDILMTTNFADPVQKTSVEDGGQFVALGGTPPQARYIMTVRDFVVLGCLQGQENAIQWSGLNNPEQWTPGLEFSDFQVFPQGGPVTGMVGGEVGYIFQRERVHRMTYVPGSDFVFQFDEIEAGRGLAFPNSLVRYGQDAYYLSDGGLYRMSLATGAAEPVGIGKFHEWFQDNIAPGSENFVYGAHSPSNDALVWSFANTEANDITEPNRVLVYQPHIDEASTVELRLYAMAQWLASGYSLDTIPVAFGDPVDVVGTSPGTGGNVRIAFTEPVNRPVGSTINISGVTGTVEANGRHTVTNVINQVTLEIDVTYVNAYTGGGIGVHSLDKLPFSLDSPFWKGGTPLLGFFSQDNALSFFQGPNMEAFFETDDGRQPGRRTVIRGVRPTIDTESVEVAIAARERDSDRVFFFPYEAMEVTGYCPAWNSGNYLRARIRVAAGAAWTQLEDLEVDAADAGVI